MNDRDSGSFAIGFIVGAVVGVAIGFLYAPKAGSETRALIMEKTGEVRDKATEVAEKAREAAVEARKKVEERLGHKEDES